MLKLSLENKIADVPDLNNFRIGDEVVADACADHDRFEGTIIGIELQRLYGSEFLQPSITLLHDGYVTDGFRPEHLRKVHTTPDSEQDSIARIVSARMAPAGGEGVVGSVTIPIDGLVRPIIGIENRTALEVFDIMADRITRALSTATPPVSARMAEGAETEAVHRDELRDAANALLNNLWVGVVSGDRTHEDNWKAFERRYPGVRWLHAALKATATAATPADTALSPATEGNAYA